MFHLFFNSTGGIPTYILGPLSYLFELVAMSNFILHHCIPVHLLIAFANWL